MKLLRFTAEWCQPCKMLARTLSDLSLPVPLEVINIDEQPEVAASYAIRSIPTLILIGDDSQEISRLMGASSKDKIEMWLQANAL